mmetsp:Transcript_5712/g.16235  ORF Transcript_5712/g.16235 Transcript_5712/m.16235 type:complete len:230 (-) Transcript_5712:303-992(-)
MNSWRQAAEQGCIQFPQADALTQQGFVVKNTFIDGPAQWWDGAPCRRAHSAPAAARAIGRESPAPRALLPAAVPEPLKVEGAPCRAELLPQGTTCSELSTTCSEADEYDSSVGDGSEVCSPFPGLVCVRTPEQIRECIERECGFLRLHGHNLHCETAKKRSRQDAVATLRFYVKGVPWVKRAKWHQAMSWTVLAMLKRAGCAAKMQNGGLFAELAGGKYLRLDFSAARF